MIINVTPIGMAGGAEADSLSFPAAAVEAAEVVFDVVALPPETPLIKAGRAAGKKVITGAEVATIQALEQFVLYTGIRPTYQQVQDAEESGVVPGQRVLAAKAGEDAERADALRDATDDGLVDFTQPEHLRAVNEPGVSRRARGADR